MEENFLIHHDDLIDMGTAIFNGFGMPREDAEIMSRSLVVADMQGIKSHGMVRIPFYEDRFKAGKINLKTELTVEKETHFSLVLNGHNGVGAVVSKKAVDLTRKKAEENGIAYAVVKESNHFGTAGYWSEMLAGEDMIGFAASNAFATVCPPAGVGRGVGSNPFSVAIPAKRHPRMCLDISNGVMAQGKIYEYARLNKPLPENAWIGPDGEMTTDPRKFDVLEYIMMPFGGHKGFGIAVIMEMLTAPLAGVTFTSNVRQFLADNTHAFFAMRIDAFTDMDKYKEVVDGYIDYLHSLPVRPGAGRHYYPGEIEAEHEMKSKKEGVLISKKVVENMIEAAKTFNYDISALRYTEAGQ